MVADVSRGRHVTDRAAELRLQVTDGNAGGTQIDVAEALVIGRRADEPGRLAGDPEISALHAEITLDAGGYFIDDLGSRHGTTVNGESVTTRRLLEAGDRIELGATTLVVEAITGVAVAPEPAPRLSLRLDIDAQTGVGRLDLGEGTQPIGLVHRDGRWEVGA